MVTLIRMAGAAEDTSSVMPRACQGSSDPCTKTTLVTATSRPPYSAIVRSTPRCRRPEVNLGPNTSEHICTKKERGKASPKG